MTDVRYGDEHRVDTLACPVSGTTVTVSATYRRADDGKRSLVDFGCSMEGTCGISAWDPCPVYVAYVEQNATMKRT